MNHDIAKIDLGQFRCTRCRLIMPTQEAFETILCKPLGMAEVERDFPVSRR